MDIATSKWFSEQDMEDYTLIHDFHMNSLAQELTTQSFEKSLSSESYFSYPNLSTSSIESFERPSKLNNEHQYYPKSCQILSFSHQPDMGLDSTLINPKNENKDYELKPCSQVTTTTTTNNKRSHSLAQDHILAERKRREKISQQFIALSAIVPGLKKMDKASVLGDAVKYLKNLQERVKVLEEQTKKRTMESVVLVKKSQLSADDDSSSCDENSVNGGNFDSALPEIEARFSDKDMLIRIHCEKQQGILPKIINQIENLHLSIINTSVLPFGSSTLDITLIAQMENEFSMGVKDLVKNLRLGFLKFM